MWTHKLICRLIEYLLVESQGHGGRCILAMLRRGPTAFYSGRILQHFYRFFGTLADTCHQQTFIS